MFRETIDDYFILPWSKVDGHRPLDLCPVLEDDHRLNGTVPHVNLHHLSHRDTGKRFRLLKTSTGHFDTMHAVYAVSTSVRIIPVHGIWALGWGSC